VEVTLKVTKRWEEGRAVVVEVGVTTKMRRKRLAERNGRRRCTRKRAANLLICVRSTNQVRHNLIRRQEVEQGQIGEGWRLMSSGQNHRCCKHANQPSTRIEGEEKETEEKEEEGSGKKQGEDVEATKMLSNVNVLVATTRMRQHVERALQRKRSSDNKSSSSQKNCSQSRHCRQHLYRCHWRLCCMWCRSEFATTASYDM